MPDTVVTITAIPHNTAYFNLRMLSLVICYIEF